MSLRERPSRNLRPRWPAQFDIEGIPRDYETRQRKKEELEQMAQTELDINNPPRLPYVHQEYPRLMYKGTERLEVADAAEEKKATAAGFSRKPDAKKLLAQRARQNKKHEAGLPVTVIPPDDEPRPEDAA